MNDEQDQARQSGNWFAPKYPRWVWIVGAIGAVAVLIIAIFIFFLSASVSAQPCDSATSDPAITPADLPAGLGRGFPVVCVGESEGGTGDAKTGEAAPNFHMVLDTAAGSKAGQFSLESLQGRPVFINFWASWCGPCRQEMPDIVQVAGEYDDLVVLAINVQEEAGAYEAFVEEFGMEMPVVLDQNGELRRLYSIRNMPTSVFINRDGTVSTVWAGFLTLDKLQEFINQIL